MAQAKEPIANPARTRAELPDTGQVVVACKYPNGLKLRIGEFFDFDEQVFGGGVRTKKMWRETGEIIINGPRGHVGMDPGSPTSFGYALTYGVPAEFMKKWLEDNADSDLVKNGLIVVSQSFNDLKDQAKEFRGKLTGLEPLAQKGDARVPKPKYGLEVEAMTNGLG